MNSQALQYENNLRNLRYYKDTGRSTLESILTKWKDAVAGLKTLVPLGYSMMDESTQVRHLMDVIEHPELKMACNPLILADDSFRRDPQKCIHLYLDYWRKAIANKKRNQSVYVSALDATDVTRYYTPNEYKNLTADEKRQIHDARKAKGISKGHGTYQGNKGKGGGGNGGGGGGNKNKRNKKKRNVSATTNTNNNGNGNNNNNNGGNGNNEGNGSDGNRSHNALNPNTRQQGTVGKKPRSG
jgi:hypothetical protein